MKQVDGGVAQVVWRHADLGLALTDAQGVLLDANPAALALTDGAVGWSVADRVHPEDRHLVVEALACHKTAGLLPAVHCRMVLAGREQPVRLCILPHPDKPTCRVWLVEDFAPFKDAHTALMDAERRLQATFDHMQDGYVLVAPDGRLLTMNVASSTMLGLAENQSAAGHDLRQSCVDPAQFDALMSHLQTQGAARGVEIGLRRPHGDVLWVDLSVHALRDGRGNVALVEGTLRDVTERREASRRERRLLDILDIASDLVLSVDGHGVLTYVNPAARSTLSLPPEGQPLQPAHLVLPQDVDTFRLGVQVALTGTPWEGTLTIGAADGRHLPVSCKVAPHLDDHGGYNIIARDISALQDAYAELQAGEERFRSLVQNLPGATFRCQAGPPWKLLYVSDAVESLTGCTAQAFMDGTVQLLDHVAPQDRALVEKARTDALEGPAPSTVEYRVYNRQGTVLWVQEKARVARNAAGQPTHMDGVLFDVTERHAMEVDLRRATVEAEAANTAKSTFLATVSHEIRTPMNAVLNMAELALEGVLDGRQRFYVEVIQRSAGTLLLLINDILDLSKIEAERMEMERAPFNLRALLEDLTEGFRGRVQERSLELVVHAHRDVPDAVVGDSLRLRQVLNNLLGNALKFTQSGLVMAEVTVANNDGVGAGALLCFKVTDTGIGIPSDKLDRLFHAFSQVDSSTTRRFGGTGLGLAISHRLVRLMGGEIHVESAPGVGSTFWFTIPLGVGAPAEAVPAPPTPASVRFVLALEDNPAARAVLVDCLEGWGVAHLVVDSLAGALAAIQSGACPADADVMLVDQSLPDADSLEAPAQLKGPQGLPGAALVLMAMDATRAATERALVAGYGAVLHKPVTRSALLDAMATALGGQGPGPAVQLHVRVPDLRGHHVLLAEDNEANVLVARELLRRTGATLDVACTGKQAVEMMGRRKYHAVLMDVQMPEMDGLTAARAIRSSQGSKRVPIVAMTANVSAGDVEACRAAGMDDYLAKPIDRALLYDRLAWWLTGQTADSLPQAPVDSPAPDAANGDPPSLPGMDLASAMRASGLEWSLFQRALLAFRDAHGRSVDKLAQEVAQANRPAIARLCHTLAGAGASLGMGVLASRARALEAAAREGAPDLAFAWRALDNEARQVLKALHTLP